MSSFNVHKSHVLDSSLPIENRFSHLRSCLNKVANLLGCSRAILVERINSSISVNVEKGKSEADLLNAFEFLLKLRDEQLHKPK
jgi:hypothetical protein